MNAIFRLLRHRRYLPVVFLLGWIALAPAGRAASPAKLEKHARKIEKKLKQYRPGAFLEVDLRNGDPILGSLGKRSGATFQMVDADSNQLETIAYVDVIRVKRTQEYIGDDGNRPHSIRHWTPLLIGAAGAAAAGASYMAVR